MVDQGRAGFAAFWIAPVSLLLAVAANVQTVSAQSWDVYIILNRTELTKRTMDRGDVGVPETIATLGQSVACTDAIPSRGLMLAAFVNDTRLFSIDMQTGNVQPLVDIGIHFVASMDYGMATALDDTVWISEYNPDFLVTTLYRIDIVAGAASIVGVVGDDHVLDLVLHDGKLFAAAVNRLLEVDISTAQPTLIIEHPFGELHPVFIELASDGDSLWCMTNTHGFPGPVFRRVGLLDPVTGEEIWGQSLADLDWESEPLTLDVVQARQQAVPMVTVKGAVALTIMLALAGIGILRVGHP